MSEGSHEKEPGFSSQQTTSLLESSQSESSSTGKSVNLKKKNLSTETEERGAVHQTQYLDTEISASRAWG